MTALPVDGAQGVEEARPGRIAIAAVAVIGTVLAAISPFTSVYDGGDDPAAMVSKVAADEGKQGLYVVFDVLFGLAYVPAVLVLAIVGVAGSRRVGGWGLGIFLTAAACMMTVASVPDFIVYAGVKADTDPAALAHVLDKGLNFPAFGIPLVYGIAGQMVSFILIGLALARGGRVPAWAGWAALVSAPLLVVGYGGGITPLVSFAYLLQVAAAVMVGQYILRSGIGWTRT